MKTILTFFIFLFLISFSNLLHAQYQLGEKWVARYNGTGNNIDRCFDIAFDGSGNVYVTGVSVGSGTNGDILTVKYNSSGVQQWAARYNGSPNLNDISNAIAVDASGNVYVTGGAWTNTTTEAMVTIKYNSSGVQQWVNSNWESGYVKYGYDLDVDGSGNVYVTGYSQEASQSGREAIPMYKINASGVGQFYHEYGAMTNGNAKGVCIKYLANDFVYVAGYSGITNNSNISVYCWDAVSGVLQWSNSYAGSSGGNDAPTAIGVDQSENLYVGGYSYSAATGYDYIIAKFNFVNGGQMWAQRFSYSNNDDYAYALTVEGNSNVYATGWCKVNASVGDIVTVKYTINGGFVWSQTYNGPGNSDDAGYSVIFDNQGYLDVSGKSTGSSTGLDCVLLRYSTAGVLQWEKRYNGPGNNEDVSYKITADANGCIYSTGYSMGSGSNYDFCTIKYVPLPAAPTLVYPPNNATGISLTPLINWNDVVNADNYTLQVSTNSGFSSFVINQTGLTASQYQVPSSTFQNNILYYWRVCAVNAAGNGPWSSVWNFRTLLVGVQPVSNEIPTDYKLYENYPNPFNPSTNIKFDIPKASFVKLVIYDLLGKELDVLVSEKLNPGTYQVDWNAGNYPSGIYFYKLTAGEFINVKKMVLVK